MKLVMAGSFLRAGCENVADIDDGELDTVQVVNHRFHVGGQPRVAQQINSQTIREYDDEPICEPDIRAHVIRGQFRSVGFGNEAAR